LECFQFSAFLFSVFSTTIKLVSDLGCCFVCLGAQRVKNTYRAQQKDPKTESPTFYLSDVAMPEMLKISEKLTWLLFGQRLPLSLSWLFSS